jgi:hypothetical protein
MGVGSHTSEKMSSKGALDTLDEIGNNNWWLLAL